MALDLTFCYGCYVKLSPDEVVWVADTLIEQDYKAPYCRECAKQYEEV